MKANQRFRRADAAVSPVIAVILMVAITVVLAATVYVWVSGFGSQSSQPAKTASLSSAGTITTGTLDGDAGDYYKAYTVASATSGMRYGDFTITVDGQTATASSGNCDSTLTDLAETGAGPYFYIACSTALGGSTTPKATTDTLGAGNYIYIIGDDTALASKTLRILDSQANSVILTLTLG